MPKKITMIGTAKALLRRLESQYASEYEGTAQYEKLMEELEPYRVAIRRAEKFRREFRRQNGWRRAMVGAAKGTAITRCTRCKATKVKDKFKTCADCRWSSQESRDAMHRIMRS